MSHKNELALLRDRQLARLREKTGKPVRLILSLACAAHDRDYLATFARNSPEQRFRCESIEPQARVAVLDRLKALLWRKERLSVPAEEVALEDVACPGCGILRVWTRCGTCGSFICAVSRSGNRFDCRPSCGGSGSTVPLVTAEGATGGGSSSQLSIGHQGAKRLTKG